MTEADVLEAARELQGVSILEQIDYAVLKKNGHVTVIPKKGRAGDGRSSNAPVGLDYNPNQ